MSYIKLFEKYKLDKDIPINDRIKNLHKVSKENKEIALNLVKQYTNAKNGVITGLDLHPLLLKKIKEGNYPFGFDMGIDKDGFFIHTHRARSKSHIKPEDITVDEIKRTDSTG